ncbi:carbohydrate porin [Parasulfuritortus cantonensis]|nr:carbohydrate porin [Parasulfuritortus cantonensis]
MYKSKALVLALAGLFAAPAQAQDNEEVLREMQRLSDRVAQLEAANRKLEAALEQDHSGRAARLADRVEAIEGKVAVLGDRPEPVAALAGASIGGSLLMVAQNSRGGSGATSQLSSRADLEVELPAGNVGTAEGRLFAHLRAGDGDGVDVGTFATANATAFNFNQPVLLQAWYQLDLPTGTGSGESGRVELTLGKIDPFGFFDANNVADDESEQFLNLAFIHNPLLDAGGDIGVGEHGASPGLRLAYGGEVEGGRHLAASLAVFGAGGGADYHDSFHKPFVIGQVEYAGRPLAGLPGTYRLYAWNNGQAEDAFTGTTERHSGWGLSADQQISGHATVFARYGHSTRGNLLFDRAVTVGVQVSGTLWGRAADRLGVAYGWLESSAESGLSGAERPFEVYYAWQINEQLALTADFQRIANPAGDRGLDDVTVLGLRAKAAF